MKNYITTTKYLLTLSLFIAVFFFGRGAPTVQAFDESAETNCTASISDCSGGVYWGYASYANNHTGGFYWIPASNETFDRVDMYIDKAGTPSDNIYLEIWNRDTSTLIDTSSTISASSIIDASFGNYPASLSDIQSLKKTFSFSSPVSLTSGVNYTFKLHRSGSDSDSDNFNLYQYTPSYSVSRIGIGGSGSNATLGVFYNRPLYKTYMSSSCTDGIMNGSETGIDIGGSCQTLVINTPVDSTDVQDFQNFSVTYSGVDVPDQNHQVIVQWSDSSSLLTTCENGVAGSLYTGSFVAGSSYSVCTNSIPRIFIDKNAISFSHGITSYTGSVPKTHSLVNGTTYYAQAFIMGDDGFYYVASDVISFTASNGVPVVTGNGTITNSAGSGTITGTGTHFTSTLHIGDTLTVGGQQCKVLSIASDTELECTPLTSAHTGASYTQNSNFDNSVLQETCSTWDFGCYIKNTISWFFGVSDSTLQNFGTLKESLFSRFPFSYIDDVGNLFGETFNQSADSFSLDITLLGNSFTVLSTAQLEAIPFQSLVRTIMGAMAMFFTVMFIYRKIIRVHDANHKTA